jgi:hypothetical protein
VLPRRSTWAYVQALRAEKTASQCLSAAREAWRGNVHARVPAESDDAVWRIALRGRPEPIDGAFADTVEALFVPLLAHLEDGAPP